MSTHPPAQGSGDGGLAARRAVARWAWRLLRREWRSQVLVTLLLLFAVAAAVCGGSALTNIPPPADPRLGTADTVYALNARDNPQAMAADLAALQAHFGTVDVVGHASLPVPGLMRPVDYRAQRPGGAYTAPLLALTRGRYPTGPAEAAVTTSAARLLGLRFGASIGLDGQQRTIVGTVENPTDLPDTFVLVDPSAGFSSTSALVFTGASGSGPGVDSLHLTSVAQQFGQGRDNSRAVIATLVFAVATILLLLVAFVAAAGFATLAHRRLRQLGMLAAIGASARHLRLVMVVGGLCVGLVGAVGGAVVGLGCWLLVAGQVEQSTGHRVDLLAIPWLLVGAIAALAVAMAVTAAWWPSRMVSRLPITLALTGRPPAPRSARRPAAFAATCLVAGLACLAAGKRDMPLLVAAGTLSTALAVLFAAPLAVRLLGRVGTRAPIAVRLALRDLSRHQARAGAALAAISLALAIPVVLVVLSTNVQASPTTGNLGERQLMIRIARPGDPPSLLPEQSVRRSAEQSAAVRQLAAGLSAPTIVALDMAYNPAAPVETGIASGEPVRHALELGAPGGPGNTLAFEAVMAYVATPDLLRLLGVDTASVPAGTEALSSRGGTLVVLSEGRDQRELAVTRFDGSGYTAEPRALLTATAMRNLGLVPVRAAWLVEADRPITSAQLGAARDIAATAGLSIESRDAPAPVRAIRDSVTAAGLLVALAVLAMVVGLIRGEGAADLRTLTATGATRGIRRTLTAATAGSLALLGALLGTVGAGLGLLAVFRDDWAVFGRIPPLHPLLILLGVPLLATAVGWLAAGKEPAHPASRRGDL